MVVFFKLPKVRMSEVDTSSVTAGRAAALALSQLEASLAPLSWF